MSTSRFQDPPQAQGYWTTNINKIACLLYDWLQGDYSPTISTGGQTIPENDEQLFDYYGATDNLAHVVYKKAGTTVATQTFEYVGGAVSNGDRISRITLT